MNKEELKKLIVEANDKYRIGDTVMSDIEYDELVDEFKNKYPNEYEEFRNTLNEGKVEYGKKVTHKFIAGSLDKLKNEEPEAIKKFIRKYIKNKMNVSAKIDGLSGILHYNNGKLIGCATRGDGETGIDISDKAQYVKGIPHDIKNKNDLYIRGELVILKSDYDKIEGNSPRNIVAGLINRKEWNKNEINNISFVAYTIMGYDYVKNMQFEELEYNGFMTSWHINMDLEEANSEDIVEQLFELANQNFDYQTDGLVLSDSEYINEDKYRPYASMAYKTNMQTFETRLIDVEWQGPSKNGAYCPVGILETVDCDGVLVSKCTLHNLDFIEEKGVKIGDIVSIVRSGDVIPKLISVISTDENSTDIEIPTHCICCGSELVKEGPFLYCKNDDCHDKTTYQVESFIKNMKVDNVSFKQLQKFGIHDFKTLLDFEANPKYKSETKFIEELKNKVFNKSKIDIFCSINMKDLAEKTLKVIIDFYGWEKIESHEIESDTFSNLPNGIGDITMNKFIDSYRNSLNTMNMIISDSRYCYIECEEIRTNTSKNGMSICFTGKLNTMGRTEASKLAEQNGYEVKSAVTKGLTYLVTNDTTTNTSKNKKARELGTKIITEDEFLKLINGKTMNPDEL